MSGEAKGPENRLQLVLVARKGAFGLPTACPSCLPVYLYLRLCGVSFDLQYDVKNPDSESMPLVYTAGGGATWEETSPSANDFPSLQQLLFNVMSE